ncbi:KPN_02809 family neutral zinc metallopeptidase [Rhodopirellula sp. P2]|uniref:KPN_02809 family neutral zinc metallopeptidase n=1 Tax=Rhodopirellula sp. P2 TaxID=2127060 RepID=UPI00236749C0|nr:neutral zinc metallopeptidase [Rhodopirellula sp. P2]WDQ16363.1 zinc metallopeptidase [Rhodopirellula sp. P2]
MRWRGRRQSDNVEDRRTSGGGAVVGGGIGVVVIAIIIGLLGGNPQQFLQQAAQQPGAAGAGGEVELTPQEIEAGEFVSTVFADTEDVWSDLFAQAGREYKKPTLVLFKDQVQSGCGMASSGTGPFYCPADEKVYLDTSFFSQLARQLGAPGDFAQAYVVAHEVGHHVQNLLGYTDQLDQIRQKVSEVEYNKYSVKLELQADFFAGVMLHHAEKKYRIIEDGDIQEAMTAARAIGDDTLQKRSRGYVQPETFNHGTSEQRLRWFTKGLQTGDLNQGDTFQTDQL